MFPDTHKNILVSVIIPCYNGEKFIAEAIQSVLEQTYEPVELVVVDDGSTDNSGEIISRYGEKITIVKQENAGLPAARNSGIRASHGDYLAFLDADDYWDNTFICKMLDAIRQSDAEIAYCGWQNLGLPGERGKPFIPPDYEAKPDKLELLIGNVRWPVHAALVTRKVLDHTGGFDPKWKSCEDFAFWIRAATIHKLVMVPEVLATYRFHGNQMTSDSASIAINAWRVQQEFLQQNPSIVKHLGTEKVNSITHGNLLRKAYDSYWKLDLDSARKLFRQVAKTGYASLKDWKYILPAYLPESLHSKLVRMLVHT